MYRTAHAIWYAECRYVLESRAPSFAFRRWKTRPKRRGKCISKNTCKVTRRVQVLESRAPSFAFRRRKTRPKRRGKCISKNACKVNTSSAGAGV